MNGLRQPMKIDGKGFEKGLAASTGGGPAGAWPMLGLLACLLFSALACKAPAPPAAPPCDDPIGCVDIAPGAPIRIGVLQALTGKAVALGLEQIRGIELALDEREGQIAGHPVDIQKEDSGCSAETGSNAALKIASDHRSVATLGTTCSIAAATASRILSDAGMVLISGNNSAPFLTTIGGARAPDWYPGYFRTANNEEHAGKAAALFAYNRLGARTAATINDGDIYTRGLTGGFQDQFSALGGKVELSATINKGDADMTPVLDAVRMAGARILFFPLFQPEGNHILRQARRHPGLSDLILMSDGALIESTFIADAGELGKGMYFVGPARPETPASDALRGRYVNRFHGEPLTSYFITAFDAAGLLFAAIEKTAAELPDGGLRIGRNALRDTLYETRGFPGASGVLNCDAFGDCASPRFNILRLDDPEKGLAGLESNIVYTYAPERTP